MMNVTDFSLISQEEENRQSFTVDTEEWKEPSPPRHEFEAVVEKEDDDEGGFSVFAVNYPGVISQGESLDEAKANVAEAFLAMLEARRKHGEDMHYSSKPVMDIPPGCQRVRIEVDEVDG